MADQVFATAEERSAEIDRIRRGMIKQDYFIMHRRSAAPELKAGVLLEHFQWIVELEKQGHILLTGGIFLRDGTQTEGLTILRAPTWEAAELLAASDPFVKSGAVSFFLERFRLGGGRITISIDLSDQTLRLA
jgi:uncharacterized protein YciI